jgi:uncharacterized phage protein (TIGR01671 family)
VSREIKFRAYDKDKKIMIHDYDQSAGKIYSLPLGASIRDFVFNLGLSYKTLMQYTGLKDKYGKEIFEGDFIISKSYPFYPIIKEDELNFNELNYIAEIYWDDEQYSFAYELHTISNRVRGLAMGGLLCEMPVKEIEIIGNIHENSELLNGN